MGSLPLKKNLQFRLLLTSLIKAGVINQANVRELIRVTDESGVEFLPISIPQRKALEKSLMNLLTNGDAKRVESQIWTLRAHFARGHMLVHSCLKEDVYADKVKQGDLLKLIHAYLLALAYAPLRTSDPGDIVSVTRPPGRGD